MAEFAFNFSSSSGAEEDGEHGRDDHEAELKCSSGDRKRRRGNPPSNQPAADTASQTSASEPAAPFAEVSLASVRLPAAGEAVVELAHGLRVVCGGTAEKQSESGAVRQAVAGGSDLVPGKYEGGFKLWECAGDLVGFLHTSFPAEHVCGKRVLEVRAGVGVVLCKILVLMRILCRLAVERARLDSML